MFAPYLKRLILWLLVVLLPGGLLLVPFAIAEMRKGKPVRSPSVSAES